MSGEAWAIIGTVAGGCLVIVGNLITTILNNRARMREKRRELIMTTALEYWKRTDEKAVALFLSDKCPAPINSHPFESFIVSIAKASEVIGSEKISEADALKIIRELRSLNLAIYQEAREHTEDVSATTTGHNKAAHRTG